MPDENLTDANPVEPTTPIEGAVPAEQVQQAPKVVTIMHYRTRYTYEVYHAGNDRMPVFELILIESDPAKLANKVFNVLAQNTSDFKQYIPKLKLIEVLD